MKQVFKLKKKAGVCKTRGRGRGSGSIFFFLKNALLGFGLGLVRHRTLMQTDNFGTNDPEH